MYFLKNKSIILVCTLVLSSCSFLPMTDGIIYEPMNVRNVYFESGGISILSYQDYLDYKTNIVKYRWIDINSDFMAMFAPLELSSNGRWSSPVLNFVVKGKNNCIIYSYSREDLIKLKTDAGFNLKSDNAIFLLERDGLRVVSRSEYERLKPTFKPHPFDASLCKVQPN